MMISASRTAALSAFAPVPLVVALAAYELPALLSFAGRDAFFGLAALAFCAAYEVAVMKVRRPQFRVTRGSQTWFLVPMLGFGIYMLGSFYGGVVLHLEGLLFMYLGLVAYLAGKRFATLLVPGVASLALLPVPTLVGSAVADALAAALLAAAALSLLVSVRDRRGSQGGCEQCRSYGEMKELFCGYCGKNLSPAMRFGVPGRRLAVTWLTSALVIAVLVGATIPLASVSATGLLVVDHRLSGVSAVTALPAYPGWTSNLTASEGNLTLTTYHYKLSGGSSVNASLALSTKDGVGALSLIDSHPDASANGTATLANGGAAVFYTWSEGGVGYTGALVTSHVTYLSSGHVVQSYAAFLFSQPSAEGSRGTLRALASDTSSAFQLAREGGPFLTTVVGPIYFSSDIAVMGASTVFLAILTGIAKSSDSEDTKRSDIAFSLPSNEFSALASMQGEKTRWSGNELEAALNPAGGWGSLSRLLERFVSLGLVEKEVAVVDGLPRLYWSSRMRI